MTDIEWTYAERAAFYELDYVETIDQPFLARLIGPTVRSVLEVPCGAGRNTVLLARGVPRYVAVDLEPNMIRRVEERTAGRPEYRGLHLRQGDIRDLRLGETFDLILVQRESLQLIPRVDIDKALRSLAEHLSATGLLCLDLSLMAEGRGDQPEYFSPRQPDGVLVHEWRRELPTGAWLSRSRVQERLPGLVRIRFYYQLEAPGQPTRASSATIEVTTYSKDELTRLASEAGLVVTRIDADYEGEPYSEGAVRMIALLARGR